MGVKLGRWSRYRHGAPGERRSRAGWCVSEPAPIRHSVRDLAVMRSGRRERCDVIVEDESEEALIRSSVEGQPWVNCLVNPPHKIVKNLQHELAEAAVRDRDAAFHLLHCVLLYAVYKKLRVMRSGRRER